MGDERLDDLMVVKVQNKKATKFHLRKVVNAFDKLIHLCMLLRKFHTYFYIPIYLHNFLKIILCII